MTEKTYKLVCVEPSEQMVDAACAAFVLGDPLAMRKALVAAIAAAPEPVCRWTFVGIGFDSECGRHVEPDHSFTKTYPFCPHCGKKVEVVKTTDQTYKPVPVEPTKEMLTAKRGALVILSEEQER